MRGSRNVGVKVAFGITFANGLFAARLEKFICFPSFFRGFSDIHKFIFYDSVNVNKSYSLSFRSSFEMSNISVVTSPVVNVIVTSSVTSFSSEKHFQKDLTVAALKASFPQC